jgi:RNA polymerase sigma factor (sigma-70 family)
MGLALRVNQSPPAATEHELVAAVRAGDDGAFEELFARYRSRISSYVLAAVGDHGRAEDVTQEVFISALRRLRDTERPISFKPWIYAIAKNACIDEFRRTWRYAEVSLEQDGAPEPTGLQFASPQHTPDLAAENRQQFSNLRGAFRGLSENHHRILVLRELEGLSYGEIGERMGMSRAMVESTLFRARKRLNQEFQDLESGRRCSHVQDAIDRAELLSTRILGTRERRQVARHLSHCHACRQHAWMAGFDASTLKRRGLAEKIAALLPIGWWRTRGGHSAHGAAAGSGAHPLMAAQLMPRIAQYGEPISQVPLGRAAAAAATLALAAAGGGYAVAGSSPTKHATPPRAAAVISARGPATRSPVIRARAATNRGRGPVSSVATNLGGPVTHKSARPRVAPPTGTGAASPSQTTANSGSQLASPSARGASGTTTRSGNSTAPVQGSGAGQGSTGGATTIAPVTNVSTPHGTSQQLSRVGSPNVSTRVNVPQAAQNTVDKAGQVVGAVGNAPEQAVSTVGNTAAQGVSNAVNAVGGVAGHAVGGLTGH